MKIVSAMLTKNPCYQANVKKADGRYVKFQKEGPKGLMLHSVGCAQPSAQVFVNKWNNIAYEVACVHAFIDADTGEVWQTLPWNYRGWHCAGSGNNTHIGVEMCESRYVTYTGGDRFTVKDLAKARADCKRTYEAAVELFAHLCREYGLDPLRDIISHREGGRAGLASGHTDPEHYWAGLGLSYTMDGFRADVANAMEEELPFSDIEGRSCKEAVLWGVERGLIVKSKDGLFKPSTSCSKAQAILWIWRLAKLLGKA